MRLQEISHREFEKLVEEALEGIPAPFLERIRNTAICVEDEPGEDDLGDVDVDDDSELLGIYRGVPFTEQSYDGWTVMPGEIVIFRGPVLRCSADRTEAIEQVQETVIHEIGHYFGLDDDEMDY